MTKVDPTPSQSGSKQRESRRRWTRPAVLIPIAVVVAGALVFAALAFQPWKLFLDETVDEAVPMAAPSGDPAAGTAPSPGASPAAEPADPTVLAEGKFISHEHETSGRAVILELGDGERVLRLEDFRTSNGPDLKVWLAAAPVREGTDGWFVFDDDEYVDLGPLKGNVGNQNYRIPPGADIKDLSSVAIWCDRFNVSFGAAELKA